MYYNREIWLAPMLESRCKNQLMAASSMALKLCESQYDNLISYEKLHELQGRATPRKMMRYRLAVQLYKVYNAKMINYDIFDLRVCLL